jgi:hypothetical protein
MYVCFAESLWQQRAISRSHGGAVPYVAVSMWRNLAVALLAVVARECAAPSTLTAPLSVQFYTPQESVQWLRHYSPLGGNRCGSS